MNATYAKPPVIEVTLQLTPVTQLSEEAFKQVVTTTETTFKHDLQHREAIETKLLSFTFGQDGSSSFENKPATVKGYRYANAKDSPSYMLQLLPEFIAVSQLSQNGPYEGFEILEKRMSAFSKGYPAEELQKIGLRSINKLVLPTQHMQEASHYVNFLSVFNLYTQFASPSATEPYVHRFFVQHKDDESIHACIQVIRESIDTITNKMVLIFDTDVVAIKTVQKDSQCYYDTIQQLRAFKNSLFEASITNNYREVIK